MKITVKVIPSAKKNDLRSDGDLIKVYLTAPALDGKANAALVKFLAGHYKVKASSIDIVKGLKSRQKIVNINGI